MAGTFVATPSKALTIEHEPTGRALTQFKPEEVRTDLGKLETLASFGVNLRDEAKLYELAVAKIAIIIDIVDWLERNVRPTGNPQFSSAPGKSISYSEAMETLGYSGKNHDLSHTWRKLARAAHADQEATLARIVLGWKMRAGMDCAEKKEKKETDRDLAVEMIFRAYTKLDPDQRIELKQKIMAFEKSYKDPFAPKAA